MLRTGIHPLLTCAASAAAVVSALTSTATRADPLTRMLQSFSGPVVEQGLSDSVAGTGRAETVHITSHLQRRIVEYPTREARGTVVVDTPNTQLYLVLGGGRAIRYGIGVGRAGFTWSGVKAVERKAEWPDWLPPDSMLKRQPYLPRFMAGGSGNPLGARALYIGGTVYRIHGTNDPSSIGRRMSSGCIRMLNEDVVDLYARVGVGTRVVVLPMHTAHRSGSIRQARTRAAPGRMRMAAGTRRHGLH
jgi:lipoprotein-anchoring transpeptidase ErfK/SrfK